jgi:hypothetical protein
MSSFSLPRSAVPAHLRLTQGDVQPGEVYIMSRVPQHEGPETPLEMLNRAEGFFPFKPAENGGVLLISKAQTVSLSIAESHLLHDAARLSAAKRMAVEVTLTDGSALSGWAEVELPDHHARLLDYLNATPEAFFAVTAADGTHFINRAHVLYARPKD